jgi:CheY-like chemotaxis protein
MSSVAEIPMHDAAGAKPRTLLVVEDEPVLRRLFAGILSAEGRVDVAADGIEALRLLRGRSYDLILTDIDMPRLDGIGLFQEVVARRPELAASFLFMTGGSYEERAQWLDGDPIPVIRKPVPLGALVSAVRKRLGDCRT